MFIKLIANYHNRISDLCLTDPVVYVKNFTVWDTENMIEQDASDLIIRNKPVRNSHTTEVQEYNIMFTDNEEDVEMHNVGSIHLQKPPIVIYWGVNY